MIISVASGKGGTGKTTIATNIALALSANNQGIAYIDCDVEEPNGHIFLNPEMQDAREIYIEVPQIDNEKCTYCGKCADLCAFGALLCTEDSVITFPEFCHGCGGCQYFCPAEAVTPIPKKIGRVEKGLSGNIIFARGCLEVGAALSPPLVDAVKARVNADISILDAPPGTSCPVIHTVRGTDFCLLVTEPTPFGLNDLNLAVQMVRTLRVPCGVLINRAHNGIGLIEQYCQKEKLPLLMTIPLSKRIAEAYSRGVPLVKLDKQWEADFRQLYRDIEELVAG
ncbi:ATP-binding protein [Desulfoscipio gibsoniae]|uniref:p-loop ATPase, MinD superfamily n=1 Tax=Desulfoscipio gibsoniae DSM 7213 TaxID=767817 RepID=R4KW92_9FIRM|nr:ATP-binding protein [Desulfoscipio gibsoniae]AGL03881.1 P-loop ATPase, MinD superfamily [Desulfoscipio gibsoniae DSM 7213]